MERPPRPRDQPMLSRRLNVWLIICGLVMAVGTLAIIAWADATYDTATAHTMGLATFSLFHLFFSLETADPERTIFSSELLDNPMLLKTSGVSILTILLATQFGPLQKILDTVELTVGEWALCVVVSASIVVICEVKKLLHIRTDEEPEVEVAEAASAARAA